MPGCKGCRSAATLETPELHCKYDGETGSVDCTCQCRVVNAPPVQPPEEDGLTDPAFDQFEDDFMYEREFENKFYQILTQWLEPWKVPGGVVCDLAHELIDAFEEYAYGNGSKTL